MQVSSSKSKDLTGIRFGKLVVQGRSHSDDGIIWECLCDCGKKTTAKTGHLNAKSIISCGCVLRGNNKKFSLEHKTHGKYDHELYRVWAGMIRRCRNPKRTDYKNYGGRGVKVCQRWQSNFIFFLEDMGERPEGYTLERIDNNKGYNKENCEWKTRADQNRNSRNSKRWTVKGLKFDSASLAGEYFGVCHVTIIRWCRKFDDCFSENVYPVTTGMVI